MVSNQFFLFLPHRDNGKCFIWETCSVAFPSMQVWQHYFSLPYAALEGIYADVLLSVSSSASCIHFVPVCHCHEGIDRCEQWLDLTAYSCLQLYVLTVWYCIFDERKVWKREKLKLQQYSISTVFSGRHWNCILFGRFLVWFNNELLFFDDKTWHFWIFTL